MANIMDFEYHNFGIVIFTSKIAELFDYLILRFLFDNSGTQNLNPWHLFIMAHSHILHRAQLHFLLDVLLAIGIYIGIVIVPLTILFPQSTAAAVAVDA